MKLLTKKEHLRRRSGTSGWSCYGSLYTKKQFQEVSGGSTLENKLQGMYLKGQNVLKKELESCKQIPGHIRVFYKDHVTNEEGEGEPHKAHEQIIIKEQYDAKY